MPQISPINWTLLVIITIFILLLILSTLAPALNENSNNPIQINSPNNIPW